MKKSSSILTQRDQYIPPEHTGRIPIRPLGHLSDFVVEQLSSVLATEKAGHLREQSEELARDAHGNISSLRSPREQKLALLDSAMLESAFSAHGEQPGPHLLSLTDCCAEGVSVPGLTYEGLIHINPLDTDPRTFSQGEIGRSELLFFDVHRRIERTLASVHVYLQELLSSNDLQEEQIAEGIHKAEQVPEVVETGFRALHQHLSLQDFTAMRAYFQNSHRSLIGPSALFSAGMYCADAHVLGSNPDLACFQDEEKFAQLAYYPTSTAFQDGFTGQEDMKQAKTLVHEKKTLGDVVPDSLHSSYQGLLQRMIDMRNMHLGVVSRFLPEAIIGTGGTEAIKDFLGRPIQAYRSSKQSFSNNQS